MGFYLASPRTRLLLGDFSPTITSGEYIAALNMVLRARSKRPNVRWYDVSPMSAADLSKRLGPLIQTFANLLRRYPDDPVAHRMLGIAYCQAGHLRTAARHFETALALLKRDAGDHPSLTIGIQIHLDAALIRVALMPIYASLGQRDALRRLASEALGPFRT